jgi:hypothetical protein
MNDARALSKKLNEKCLYYFKYFPSEWFAVSIVIIVINQI